jgi:hypothetical protein
LQAQNFLIVIIVAAIVDFIVGAIIGPKDDLQEAQGFVGFNCEFDVTLFSKDVLNSYSLPGQYNCIEQGPL